ncbi:4788_t:CDS:2 [Paraglomus brasilianum]|uniref:4788_t:CDS:1 n=1 Tax=Paraglomus brasilianum TaxID=144538 RepID=A0A9N9CRK1_9GLOM|nr:4788_t:CDS:2 [Paraglomus brasilianum]
MPPPLDNSGFNYFVETPSDEWDTLAYHKAWQIRGFPMVKSTLTRSFDRQVNWFLEHGLPAEKKKAKSLKNQFKIDAQEGGCIFDFWKRIMHSTKLDDIEMKTALNIRKFQAQHHITVANRMLTGNDYNVVQAQKNVVSISGKEHIENIPNSR